MSGSNRSIILALGLMLGAAGQPPNPDRQKAAKDPASKVEESLEDVASSLREANKPSDLEQPCEEGDNKRSSDLCAQWKAADAATSSNDATWLFGALGSLIGSLTLAAAVGAAIYARAAAKHSREGNDIARAAQRAWVKITIDPVSVYPLAANGLSFHVNFAAQNMGQTTAQNFELNTGVLFRGQAESTDDFTDRIHAKIDRWKAEYRLPDNASLLPQDIEIDSFDGDQSEDALQWWDGQGWPKPSTQPVFLAAVFYRIVNDPNTIHLSWRTWYIGYRNNFGKFSPRIFQTDSPIEAPILSALPFHTTLMHEEYPAEDKAHQPNQ